MIVLNTASDVVRIVTASANAVDCHVTYVDNVTSTPYLAARQNTTVSAAATTTILSSPSALTQRQIKKLTIVAKGGSNNVTIQLFNGATAFLLFGNGIAIAVGETIEYEDATGWRVTDANGQLKQTNLSVGRLLAVTTLTAGTTFTWNTLTRSAIVEMVGGGAGAGGCANPTAGNVTITTGGSSGGYCRKYFGITGTTATYAIGAGGAGGNTSGTNGVAGGTTTFVNGAVSLTAFGGNASPGDATTGGTGAVYSSVVGPGVGSGGDINANGFRSGYAVRFPGTTLAGAGNGGPSFYGDGGNAGNVSAGGSSPSPGGGGAGTLALIGAGQAGGAGAAGVITVWEFT